ncbi:muconate/chloromuconate family cycloisomerase [Mycobacterium colombiense]|uniref:muconate/chloromuconate family cycloisomerase n=1 Tax=Mycobacterium colombiense TaxID=339268 RepID=UPI00200AFD42|nr:muconate/chloromuconate family cycloisomerase [Mycobacterium colombiense]MCK8646701.1 muconate/chloromuconate family cycloisomerase [Mycobacterium colombiense]
MNDLTIDGVHSFIVDVPLLRPHKFATSSMDKQPLLLVAIRTAGGAIGYGEGVVPGGPWWGGESVETMQAIIERYIAPILIGRRVDEITGLMLDIERVVANARFAKAAIDVALHDAWGRCLGVPVHSLLGGAFRDSVEVTWALGVAPAEEIVEEAEAKLTQGLHHSFKLKMGGLDPQQDTERVATVAKALRGKASLRVDLNARWDRLTALRFLPHLVDAGIELIEQPTPGDQLEVLAELNRVLAVPLMADESVCAPHDAFEVSRRQAADVIAVKTTKCGGLARSAEVVAVARAAGIACHCGTSIEGPIGTAAAIHFACAQPGINFGSELFGPLLFTEQLSTDPLRYADGKVALPEGPGLGVDLDLDAIKALTRS